MELPTIEQRIKNLEEVKTKLEETYCFGKFAKNKETYDDVMSALNDRIKLISKGGD